MILAYVCGGNATHFRCFMAPNACDVHALYSLDETHPENDSLTFHGHTAVKAVEVVRNATKIGKYIIVIIVSVEIATLNFCICV